MISSGGTGRPSDAELGGFGGDDGVDGRVGGGGAALVGVVAAAGFLAVAAGVAEGVGDGGALAEGAADAHADVEPGEVGHGEGAHLEAEAGECAVDVRRAGAVEQEAFGGFGAAGEHAVADEAEAIADGDGDLAEALADCGGGGDDFGAGLGAADDFEQAHDVGGAEEVHAEDVAGAGGGGGDLVDVEIAGVGGEDGAGFGEGVELAEDVLLDGHFLEDGFDDDVGAGEVGEADLAGDAGEAGFGFGLGDAAAFWRCRRRGRGCGRGRGREGRPRFR